MSHREHSEVVVAVADPSIAPVDDPRDLGVRRDEDVSNLEVP